MILSEYTSLTLKIYINIPIEFMQYNAQYLLLDVKRVVKT